MLGNCLPTAIGVPSDEAEDRTTICCPKIYGPNLFPNPQPYRTRGNGNACYHGYRDRHTYRAPCLLTDTICLLARRWAF